MSTTRNRTAPPKYAKTTKTSSSSKSSTPTSSTTRPKTSTKQDLTLTPSQQEFYRGLAGDGRYKVDLTPEELTSKATTYCNANAPLPKTSKAPTVRNVNLPLPNNTPARKASPSSSSYRGISYETLADMPTKNAVAYRFASAGRSLTPSEVDSVWDAIQVWEDNRQKVLNGEITGETPSYKGISYDDLIGKGGKEWIAYMQSGVD